MGLGEGLSRVTRFRNRSRMIDFQCLADRMQGQMRAGLAIKILIFALLVLSLGSSLAGPLQNPKRVVNGQTVDLNPLFQWWSKHNGYRPLAAWVHITGSIAGTNGVGWIVAGKIEKSPVHATDGTHESSGEEE